MTAPVDATQTPAWSRLTELFHRFNADFRARFADDPARAERYSRKAADLFVDLSKNYIDEDILAALLQLAEQTGITTRRAAMFAGEHINVTEDRAPPPPAPPPPPAAPFPYANSWGLAFTVLTPVMFAFFARTRSWLLRIFLAIVLGASVVPLVATSNRGMFIGLGFATAYVIIRLIIGRYWGLVTAAGVMVVGVVTALIASGTVAAILGRQQYSDSTGGRAALYRSTWAASLESPIVGYGTPRMELSVGVSMGTQGYLWTLMFCFGFVGLAIYALFILSTLGEGLKVRTPAGFWLHSIPVCSCVVIIFYSFDVAQLSVLLLSAMACIRAQYYREEL